jgi:hypothetical protein
VGGGGLTALNSNPALDLRTIISSDPGVDVYTHPILTMRNELEFHDSDTFLKKFSKSKHPIFINKNIQSLNG